MRRAVMPAAWQRSPEGSEFDDVDAVSPTAARFHDAATDERCFRFAKWSSHHANFGGEVSRCPLVQPTFLTRRSRMIRNLSLVCLWIARPPWAPALPCNEEGFGTLSRQLRNDQGYRSSCAGVRVAASPAGQSDLDHSAARSAALPSSGFRAVRTKDRCGRLLGSPSPPARGMRPTPLGSVSSSGPRPNGVTVFLATMRRTRKADVANLS
jgi:hypothetical protein